MTTCPLCKKPVVEISSHGEACRWRCTGCRALIVQKSADATRDRRMVAFRVESIEADRLIRESGCTPPRRPHYGACQRQ